MCLGRGHAPLDLLRARDPICPLWAVCTDAAGRYAGAIVPHGGPPRPPCDVNLACSAAASCRRHPGARHIIHIGRGRSQAVGSAAQFIALSRQWPAATADETLCNHVTQRRVRSIPIFDRDGDRELYLSLLREHADRQGLRFHAWCLMPACACRTQTGQTTCTRSPYRNASRAPGTPYAIAC